MAKLHSELRIKAVDNITGGSEGDPSQFSEGDIVYDLTSGKFKTLDNLGAWQDAVTGVSADLSSTSVSALSDINFNSVNLDGANGAGKVLAWDQTLQAFVPIDPSSGTPDKIETGDTSVKITDTGTDGNIEFRTDNTPRWNIGPQGHLIPEVNNQYDIGSAELKVRDMYISSASLWIGDEHKVAVGDDGKMKFLKRKKGKIPSGAQVLGDDLERIQIAIGDDARQKTLETMTLEDWGKYARAKGVSLAQVYNKDEELDWEQEDAQVDSAYIVRHQSTNYLKSFEVAVDNKNPEVWKGGGTPERSDNAFYIDGVPHPELKLKAGTYRFYQRHPSNVGHPLGIFVDEARTSMIASGISWHRESDNTTFLNASDYATALNGHDRAEVANAGYYVTLVIDETQPSEMWYECMAHGLMGMRIYNESVVVGAVSSGELDDIDLNGVENGDGLVYNGGTFRPAPILQGSICSVVHTADANPNEFALHRDVENCLGGRILLDLENNSGALDVILDVSTLLGKTPQTMNFEIFSKGTTPFNVTALSTNGDVTLKSFVSQDVRLDSARVNANDAESISVGEGQMMILFCDGSSWYYEIRAGL